MRTLERRVRRLEEVLQCGRTPAVRLLWDDEVVACGQHAGCAVDRQSGAHYAGVIRLSFGGDHE